MEDTVNTGISEDYTKIISLAHDVINVLDGLNVSTCKFVLLQAIELISDRAYVQSEKGETLNLRNSGSHQISLPKS